MEGSSYTLKHISGDSKRMLYLLGENHVRHYKKELWDNLRSEPVPDDCVFQDGFDRIAKNIAVATEMICRGLLQCICLEGYQQETSGESVFMDQICSGIIKNPLTANRCGNILLFPCILTQTSIDLRGIEDCQLHDSQEVTVENSQEYLQVNQQRSVNYLNAAFKIFENNANYLGIMIYAGQHHIDDIINHLCSHPVTREYIVYCVLPQNP